jgi:hypothetical protein
VKPEIQKQIPARLRAELEDRLRGGLMTTEQLMAKILQDMKRMSPEQKAMVRQELDKAFPHREVR